MFFPFVYGQSARGESWEGLTHTLRSPREWIQELGKTGFRAQGVAHTGRAQRPKR